MRNNAFKKEKTKTLEEFGYIKDEEPRFSSVASYTKYCEDGCCRMYDLVFYKTGYDCEECFVSYELLQAIYNESKKLNLL